MWLEWLIVVDWMMKARTPSLLVGAALLLLSMVCLTAQYAKIYFLQSEGEPSVLTRYQSLQQFSILSSLPKNIGVI
jgi:hypothetical protein